MDHNFLDRLCMAMLDEYAGDAPRMNHFMKVHAYAAVIGKLEGLDDRTQLILEAASYVHDIGIHTCEEKYQGNHGGKLQELEGPPLAEAMMKRLGADPEIVERVSYLVGHHHTYTNVDGLDYQILLEADFLVNLDEEQDSIETVKKVEETIFRTNTGKRMLRDLFLTDKENGKAD